MKNIFKTNIIQNLKNKSLLPAQPHTPKKIQKLAGLTKLGNKPNFLTMITYCST